jgi:hypothetical protein
MHFGGVGQSVFTVTNPAGLYGVNHWRIRTIRAIYACRAVIAGAARQGQAQTEKAGQQTSPQLFQIFHLFLPFLFWLLFIPLDTDYQATNLSQLPAPACRKEKGRREN